MQVNVESPDPSRAPPVAISGENGREGGFNNFVGGSRDERSSPGVLRLDKHATSLCPYVNVARQPSNSSQGLEHRIPATPKRRRSGVVGLEDESEVLNLTVCLPSLILSCTGGEANTRVKFESGLMSIINVFAGGRSSRSIVTVEPSGEVCGLLLYNR